MLIVKPLQGPGRKSRLGIIVFLKELYARINEDRVLAISGGVTFFALLAVFPAVAAGVSLFGLVENIDKANYDLSRLSGLLPGGAIDIITQQVRRTIARSHNTLGWVAIAGFLFSIWSANAGIKSIFDALNVVLRQRESRGFIALNAVSLLFTFGSLLAIVTGAALLIWISSWLHLNSPLLFWPAVAIGGVILWIAIALAIALLYRFGPSGNDIAWRWIRWGSAVVAMAWLCFSAAFSWYAAHFGSFDKTYGSLGAAIGFMMWIWLSTVVLLGGEEINEILDKNHEKAASR